MLLTLDVAESLAPDTIESSKSLLMQKTSSQRTASANQTYDIFLSHSYSDSQINLRTFMGVVKLFQNLNYSVYVDWITTPQLNRASVTSATASTIRDNLDRCRCLVYLVSQNSIRSVWMPWELGYKDGRTKGTSPGTQIEGKTAIFPVFRESQTGYRGQEYLGVYPYLDVATDSIPIHSIYVNFPDARSYETFPTWLNS